MWQDTLLLRGRRDAIETTHLVDIIENFRSRNSVHRVYEKLMNHKL